MIYIHTNHTQTNISTFQNSLPVHFFNTIGHVNHHQHASYKNHSSVPYHCVNDNSTFNPQPFLIHAQHLHPTNVDSILKAPANFRDSALYTNDPSDPMFRYNIPQHRTDGEEALQAVSGTDQRKPQEHYFHQPSYTNIPGIQRQFILYNIKMIF